MSEYVKYLIFLVKEKYKEEIKIIGEKNFKIILEENDLTKNKNNFVIVLEKEEYIESFYKILSYIKQLEEYYVVIDVDFLKIKDQEKYSKEFMPIIFAVTKKTWNKNYDILIKKRKEYLLFKKKLDNLLNENIMFSYKINSIDLNNNDLKCMFIKILNKYFKSQNKLLRKKIENNEEIFNKIINNQISNEKYELNLPKKEKLQINKNLKDKKIKISENSNKIICIIYIKNKENLERLIHLLTLNQFYCVVVSNEKNYKNAINVNNIEEANLICGEFKSILISDNVNQEVEEFYFEYNKDFDKLIDKIIKYINSSIFNLKPYANLSTNNCINVLTSTFLNFDGTNYYSGGAERYLIDLYKVSKKLGSNLRVYQKANHDYVRYYEDIEIIGISDNNKPLTNDSMQNILNRFNNITLGVGELNIYSSFMECMGNPVSPSIGISHGVAWDTPKNKYIKNNKEKFYDEKSWILESALNCDKLISVDTNTANWFQTFDYKLGNMTEVIPNYVDINEFSNKNSVKSNDKIILIYPRRLYRPRGMYMLLDIVDDLLQKYENLEIHFIGKGFKEDTINIEKKIKKWGSRIKMYNKNPNEMHEVYKMADISVIPTLYSEGTSLSCLEAMASGNAVISTRIGGLTDIIINNYNGKLIEPNSISLNNAIIELIEKETLRKKISKNAIAVAKTFNKTTWTEKWKKVINEYKLPSKEKYKKLKLAKIYIPTDKIENSKELVKLVKKLMKNNYLIYIISNNSIYVERSYGKLQFIDSEDELYKEADIVYLDVNYKINIKEKKYIKFEF